MRNPSLTILLITFLCRSLLLNRSALNVNSLLKYPSKTESFYEVPQFERAKTLFDISKNCKLSPSDDLLFYTLSLLRGSTPDPPKTTTDEWSALFDQLRPHWIIPYLYWKIGHLPIEFRPPESIVSQMRKGFLASQARHLAMERQISDILDAFNSEKVSALVIKGPALTLTVYPATAARPCSDIDLLVRPEQYVKAREILNRIGYRCRYNRFDNFKEFFNSEPFSCGKDPTKPYEVDLHWDVFQYHGLKRENAADTFFDRKITVETPRFTLQTLNTVDALLQAAFHLVLHHPESFRLIWISDIALLCQKLVDPKDLKDLRSRTSEFKLGLAMEKALKLAQFWNGIRLPEGYDDFTHWPNTDKAEKVELEYVTNNHTTDIRLCGYIETLRESSSKIRYLMKFLFPPSDYIRATHPPSRNWLLPFSYVRRWAHWIGKLFQYGLHAWQTEHTPK